MIVLLVYDMPETNCFGGTCRYQLNIILLASRDTPRKKDGMCLSIVVEEADEILDLNER